MKTNKRAICVVTGGAGFIGHHLVNLLISKGYNVVVIDDLSTGKEENINKKALFIKHDISEPLDFEFKKAAIIFHLASCTSIPESFENPIKYKKTILDGTRNVLEFAFANEIKKIVFSSSAAVYGEAQNIPIKEDDTISAFSPYARYKYKSEELIRKYHDKGKIQGMILRYFNVYGEGQPKSGTYAPAVARFLDQKEKGVLLTVTGDGLQTRDYVYVGDVVSANYAAYKYEGEDFLVCNIASGKEYRIIDIAKAISSDIKFIEPRREVRRSRANINRARTLLNFKPEMDLFSWIKKIGS